MLVLNLRIAAFPSFVDIVWLSAKLERKFIGRADIVLLHQLLLLGGTWFSS